MYLWSLRAILKTTPMGEGGPLPRAFRLDKGGLGSTPLLKNGAMDQQAATPEEQTAEALMRFVDLAPSPFHAAAEVATRLAAAGFEELAELDAWQAAPPEGGRYFVRRAGSLVAWCVPASSSSNSAAAPIGFRVVAAHTDSPNLRIKARPSMGRAGVRQLGVEVYGGVLLNSWLDRDLGLSGRVIVRDGDKHSARLLRLNRPLLRVPQLAIHLDRTVNTKGLVLNPQEHLNPVWGLGAVDEGSFERLLAAELDVEAADILSWDVMCHDVQPSARIGLDGEFISAPRLDNLCSSYCGLEALLAHTDGEPVPVLCLFDHEEVGSASTTGASSPVLKDLIERVVLLAGGGREDLHRAIAASFCVSVDMAHATHPNWPGKHDPRHWIEINAGPVIKINTNQRYATDAEGEALFQRACERAGVPVQKYFHRGDLGCGSTIGPITAANLGMRTVDVGNPQWAMHSIREMCGTRDPALLVGALSEFFSDPTV